MKGKIASIFVLVFVAALCIVGVFPAFSSIADSWITKASLPYPIMSDLPDQVAVVDGKIYAIARNTNHTLALTAYTEIYDPNTNTWTVKTPIPVYISYYVVAACQNKIYVIGDAYNVPALNHVYDPVSDTWAKKTPMPTSREWMQTNVVDGKIFVIGGVLHSSQGNGEISQKNEVYDPVSDSWSEMAPIPTRVCGYASAVLDNKIYMIGGINRFNYGGDPSKVNLVQIFDPKTNQWTQGTPMSANISAMGATATMGFSRPKLICVVGGHAANGAFLGWTQFYDPQTQAWSSGPSMPKHYDGLSMANVNDMLYVIGGSDNWLYAPLDYGTITSSLTAPPSASPTATPTPTPTFTSSPTENPTPTPEIPTPTPNATLSPSSTPTAMPTPTFEPTQTPISYQNQNWILFAATAAAILIGSGALIYLKKRKGKQ